jgi:hypothetical protein
MKYLLDADDAEMSAWKSLASDAGVSFAEWLRQAARELALPAALLEVPHAPESARPQEPARTRPVPASPAPAPASAPAVPNVQTAPRRHWDVGRLAQVECESRDFVDGKCTLCGRDGP